VVLAAAIAVAVSAFLVHFWGLHRGMGDTDDAMRLVMVRDLVAGRGWYDQAITRVAPPAGFYMHWSRLLDGGLAATIEVLRLFLSPAKAEWATRNFWPLAWIFPGVTCALIVARNLGARSAVLLTAPLMLLDLALYRQFIPIRIDHHNIQIVMTVAALACALVPVDRPVKTRAVWAAVGGVLAALGLAIGLEALAFQALIGAGFGLELARNRQGAKPAMAYGLALAGATVAFFLIQTPPWRWSLSVCDALGLNLTAGLTVAGLGLALVGALAGRVSTPARIVLLAAAGAAAAGAYLVFDPACIHGPFAAMDPRVRPFWFNHIQEVQTLPVMMNLMRKDAILAATAIVMSVIAGGYMVGRQWPRPSTASLMVLALLVVAAITAWLTWRMQDYVMWIGIPALGAALSLFCQRWLRDKMVPSVVLALLLAPTIVGVTIDGAIAKVGKPHRNPPFPGLHCFAEPAFAPLAKLPPGVVMATQDFGSYILQSTHHSVLIAPYHRLSGQILAVHDALNAPPNLAEARVRALGADYLVDCPTYPLFIDPGSFGERLRKGPAPAWLIPLSAPRATLRIYKVRPIAASVESARPREGAPAV
jgi:hypothetical protein